MIGYVSSCDGSQEYVSTALKVSQGLVMKQGLFVLVEMEKDPLLEPFPGV